MQSSVQYFLAPADTFSAMYAIWCISSTDLSDASFQRALTGRPRSPASDRAHEMDQHCDAQVKDAEAKFQASVAAADVTVDEASLKSVDEMHQIAYMAEKVSRVPRSTAPTMHPRRRCVS